MANSGPGRPVEILLVEDRDVDIEFAVEAVGEFDASANVHVAEDGVEALAFLRRQGEFAGVPRPDLILLDLSMPKKNGLEVLAEVKADPALKRIPVVVLTVSPAEKDILAAYDLHANAYVTKGENGEQFGNAIRKLLEFWVQTVQLPPS